MQPLPTVFVPIWLLVPNCSISMQHFFANSYPLVLTRRSETPAKAFIRYSMTGHYIRKLYEEHPWEVNSSIRTINAYHSSASKLTRQSSISELKRWTPTNKTGYLVEFHMICFLLANLSGKPMKSYKHKMNMSKAWKDWITF